MFGKLKKYLENRRNKVKDNIEKGIVEYKESIVPFYLNQRIVYDTLAIINDGFTELYNVSNANSNNNSLEGIVSAKLDTSGNPLTLMSTSIGSELRRNKSIGNENKEEFKKVHTPTSLFSEVYRYLNKYKMIRKIEEAQDIYNLQCGDFIEFHTKLSINTTEEMFRKMKKMCNIGEIFTSFGDEGKELINAIQIFKNGTKNRKVIRIFRYTKRKNKIFCGKYKRKKYCY